MPELIEGPGCITKLSGLIQKQGKSKSCVVTDKVLHRKLGMLDSLKTKMDDLGMDYVMFDTVDLNSTDTCVYADVELFKENECDCFIALGGLSMDATKAIAAVAVKDKPVENFRVFSKLCAAFRQSSSYQ
ncbi:MAG: iron-containing alcohol dehydrogenase [Eggerthellaceae bacterium]|nr:iron-containing alcohol dehydrogenase [Eggerthellaceae bacterium]